MVSVDSGFNGASVVVQSVYSMCPIIIDIYTDRDAKIQVSSQQQAKIDLCTYLESLILTMTSGKY
jgi:hypothetical protein